MRLVRAAAVGVVAVEEGQVRPVAVGVVAAAVGVLATCLVDKQGEVHYSIVHC